MGVSSAKLQTMSAGMTESRPDPAATAREPESEPSQGRPARRPPRALVIRPRLESLMSMKAGTAASGSVAL